jgi:DNA-binding protein H-NS
MSASETDQPSSVVVPRGSVLTMLDKMSAQELTGLIQAAEAKRCEKLDAAKQDLIAEFQARASSLGISLESLFPQPTGPEQATPRQGRRKPRSDAGRKLATRYRGPNGEKWTGRGRVPTWLTGLEAQGHKRTEFEVNVESTLP